MKIYYVTSNLKKFEEASLIFNRTPSIAPHSIEMHAADLDELQGSPEQIARHKAIQAFQQLQHPVIIDDVSVHCPALGGLPGPYIRSFLESLGEEGFYQLLSHYSDRSCTITCTIGLLTHEGQEPLIFQGSVQATAVPPKGHLHHGKISWNCIMQPEGFDKTFGELTLDEFSQISHRFKALEKLKKYLQKASP